MHQECLLLELWSLIAPSDHPQGQLGDWHLVAQVVSSIAQVVQDAGHGRVLVSNQATKAEEHFPEDVA